MRGCYLIPTARESHSHQIGLIGLASNAAHTPPVRRAGSRGPRTAYDPPLTERTATTTSPGSGWRPSALLEKTALPSTDTSKTPPDDGTIVTSTPGNSLRNSAANLAARGS